MPFWKRQKATPAMWYDAGQTMTEADKMVDDFRKGQIEWNKEDISLLAQPELRM